MDGRPGVSLEQDVRDVAQREQDACTEADGASADDGDRVNRSSRRE